MTNWAKVEDKLVEIKTLLVLSDNVPRCQQQTLDVLRRHKVSRQKYDHVLGVAFYLGHIIETSKGVKALAKSLDRMIEYAREQLRT